MLTLEEGIKKAEETVGGIVVTIRDCGDRWSFSFKEDEGKFGAISMFIFKEDGEIEYFLMDAENIAILKNGKDTPLPNNQR